MSPDTGPKYVVVNLTPTSPSDASSGDVSSVNPSTLQAAATNQEGQDMWEALANYEQLRALTADTGLTSPPYPFALSPFAPTKDDTSDITITSSCDAPFTEGQLASEMGAFFQGQSDSWLPTLTGHTGATGYGSPTDQSALSKNSEQPSVILRVPSGHSITVDAPYWMEGQIGIGSIGNSTVLPGISV